MNMWLLWLLLMVLTGIGIIPIRDLDFFKNERKRRFPLLGVIRVQNVPCLKLGPGVIPVFQPILLCVAIFIFAFVNDMTYAVWVGSTLGFLTLLTIFGFFATFIDLATSLMLCNNDGVNNFGDKIASNRPSKTVGYLLIVIVLAYFGLLVAVGQMLGVVLVLIVLAPLLVVGLAGLGPFEYHSLQDGFVRSASILSRNTGGLRAVASVAVFIFLILASLTPYSGDLDFNPTFESLNDTADNAGEPNAMLTDSQEVRVISWDLATEYLQRAYSDAASTLSTEAEDLQGNTDPAYVNGRIVWVNAPRYEYLKWMGDKEIPFVVSVVNDPQNMSQDGFDAITKTGFTFPIHKDRVSWGQRLDQVLHDRYAGKYVKVQVRITLDDEGKPWWVVYLGQRHVTHNVVTLKRILVVDATDMDNNEDYDIDAPDIPEWLEVVYPDSYIYDWAKRWGKWREGILYRFFTKRHLSYPDDTPRFLILDQTPYWYVPMKKLDSKVLAGYILMNTRTGETIYHNREITSMADRSTAHTQVERYLLSGIEGFRKLTIQEGYLYPIQMDSGSIREAYIFPLYSGFTIQQYAIVDAQYYTQEPVLSTDLDNALAAYRSLEFNLDGNRTYTWEEWRIENGYVEDSEAAITANLSADGADPNATGIVTTTVIYKKDLDGGAIQDPDNEWRELRLAISEFERTGNATVAIVITGGRVVDVDYAEADLVSH